MKETVGTRGLQFNEPLLFEQGSKGRIGSSLPPPDVPTRRPERLIPKKALREEIEGFPELSEPEVVRHFTRLSQWNYGIDVGFYPLGSCTMKYNPRVNEDMARLPGFARLHPYTPEALAQGALQLMWELERYLAEISGMDRVTLQPAAGAHGELTALMMIRAYLESRGNPRRKVLVPDSAHGTNPASSTLCGYSGVSLKSGPRGIVEPSTVASAMDEEVAAIMITNPNTLGLFEEHLLEIAEIVHEKGGQVYCDGANLNALLGIARPGDMGIDAIQFNLHKTFSTPHGGGGPGAGPVGIKAHLAPFRPVPTVERKGDRFCLNDDLPQSVGKVRSFYGNFGTMVRAYAYIRALGPSGLRKVAERAVINANYLMSHLKGIYHLPYDRFCKHEVIFTDAYQQPHGVSTMDIAKRLIDYGFHSPTIYFPLIVKGALMMEPTETESKETLDQFIEAMKRIAKEAEEDPELLHKAPHHSKVTRLDEVRAARQPNLRWRPQSKEVPEVPPGALKGEGG
ncbi:MAG: aminomethyl-transferring glycine dehydrogenase subunit GcvPB [candidate division NC10 bacterium]|nr:aminomethyl-transferring glycine dehydrogenase subunit GcvPB [candidate division NC10 bacterium]